MSRYHISATVTTATSDKQRAFAQDVAPWAAAAMAKVFEELRNEQETDVERGYVDAAVERLQGGAPASFWIEMKTGYHHVNVAMLLACRGTDLDPFVDDRQAIAIAAMV